MSLARISVSVDSLLRLPAGASYHERSGRAGAEVSLKGDTIIVTATCDSLRREAEYYEELYCRAREALEERKNETITEEEQHSEPLANPVMMFVTGIAAGALATLVIIKTK